jgi:Zn-dependent protease
MLDGLRVDPVGTLIQVALFLVGLVAAVTVHEFSHALVATRLGDSTPQRMGRLTLMPLPHLDVLGSLMILMAGFGWGKPVLVNPFNLRIGVRPGMAVVSLAGPASNFLFAAVLAMAFRGTESVGGEAAAILARFLSITILLNIVLGIFNLIPISPLDGFKVALGVLPTNLATSYARTEPYGPFILLGIILLDIAVPGLGILSTVLGPPVTFIVDLLIG